MIPTTEPLITIVKNPLTNEFTLTLQHWDTPEIVDGYTKDEAEELIEQLQRGIHHLNECWDGENTKDLFESLGKKDEEAKSR